MYDASQRFSKGLVVDPLTQGLLGAAAPQSLADENSQRNAAILGFLGGMAPDVDVFIRSSSDPLLFLDYHRHFTHSLFFIPFGGLIVALVLCYFFRRSLSFKSVYLFSTLGYATHALLDACTSYGTKLLWPFTSMRVAWDNVAVVDFFLTLPLGLLVLCAFIKRSRKWARLGLLFVLIYLLLGVVQRERAKAFALKQAALRGHAPQSLVVKPTLANLWLWRSIYEEDGHFYVDAVWTLPFFKSRWYEGESLPKLNPSSDFPHLKEGSRQAKDLARFTHFSSGYVALHPTKKGVVGDVRYALLPNQVKPLWGIHMDTNTPDRHVKFENFRDVNPKTWQQYFRMLRGQSL